MSAWIVSKKHIDLMVAAVAEGTRDKRMPGMSLSPADRTKLGQKLLSECVESVGCRYQDSKTEGLPGPCDEYYREPYTFEHPGYLPSAAELYKAVHCYGYQSCEHPGWARSKAKAVCDVICRVIEAAVPEAARMRDERNNRSYNGRPIWREYEAAPWGFDVDNIAICFAKSHPDGIGLVRAASEAKHDDLPKMLLSDWLMERGMIAEPLDALHSAYDLA